MTGGEREIRHGEERLDVYECAKVVAVAYQKLYQTQVAPATWGLLAKLKACGCPPRISCACKAPSFESHRQSP